MTLTWGVLPHLLGLVEDPELLVGEVDESLMAQGWCQPGDLVVIVAGQPIGMAGTTNTLQVHIVGEAV